jgi:hypothetical protein
VPVPLTSPRPPPRLVGPDAPLPVAELRGLLGDLLERRRHDPDVATAVAHLDDRPAGGA